MPLRRRFGIDGGDEAGRAAAGPVCPAFDISGVMNIVDAIKLHSAGNIDAAASMYTKILALQPGDADALNLLGVACYQRGDLDVAERLVMRAVRVTPAAQYYANLALARQAQGRLDEAGAAMCRALALQPGYAEAHSSIGSVFQGQGKLDCAAVALGRALTVRPDYQKAHLNLALVYLEKGMGGAAVAAFRRTLALEPAQPVAHAYLSHQSRYYCEWSAYQFNTRRLLQHVREGAAGIPPLSVVSTESTSLDQLACARRYSEAWRAGRVARFRHHGPYRSGTIQLGYLSADLHDHAVAHLIAGLFEHHDRSRFTVAAYSYGPDHPSAMRARLLAAFDRFTDIRRLPHAAAARRIHDDKIDIVIDLTGYTLHSRTAILAHRPAPVQVAHLGFPGTLGADFIDYVIADPVVAPADRQFAFSERLVHLPHSYQPNDTRRPMAETTPSRDECGLPEHGFVFCCFNSTYKITPPVFDVWMHLLRSVPGSVLWLLEGPAATMDNLRREAAARSVAPERLVFAPRRPLPDHLARHRLADLFLDTLPYNAHTTASDALWAGLPVLTCLGETFAGRVAASLLSAVGMPEMITGSLPEYQALALRLSRDAQALGALRRQLSAKRLSAPLFDIERFARHIESAYSRMWALHRAGLPPAPFTVSPC